MTSAYISIGRNVNGTPMPALRWAMFQNAVRLVGWRYGTVVSATQGTGLYDGQSEETYIIVVSVKSITGLREDLALLARNYDQDCIALVVAEPEFVAAQEVAKGA